LGVERNKVVIRVKRLGGGFGGKETRFTILSNPVAIAAHKLVLFCLLTLKNIFFKETI